MRKNDEKTDGITVGMQSRYCVCKDCPIIVSLAEQAANDLDDLVESGILASDEAGYYLNLIQDWELAYFKDVVIDRFRNDFRERKFKQIIELFEKYRYDYTFNRRNVASALKITENTASITINKCVKLGIVERVKRDEYRFVRSRNGKKD